ncbi:MAG: homocysteine S-methyltransferase family protein, partial [Anaerolineales bacterium]|nr:homocysteine S-methyltransferase family protein [Anaerolineales bacterium]
IYDGAMGTSLQNQNLTAEHFGGEQYNGCNDFLVISYPEAVEKVHRSFLEVGVDVIETDTFRSNRITMKEYGLQDRVIEINMAAASLARRLADEYSNKSIAKSAKNAKEENLNLSDLASFAVQKITPRVNQDSSRVRLAPQANCPPPTTPNSPTSALTSWPTFFCEQATGLIRGGVDVLFIMGADIINLADSPMARMRMSAWAVCDVIQHQVGIETTLHFPTRGRNLLRIQGDLLAAHALGIHNVFVVMGDPTAIGDYPEAMDNYDLVPSGLIKLIKRGKRVDRETGRHVHMKARVYLCTCLPVYLFPCILTPCSSPLT